MKHCYDLDVFSREDEISYYLLGVFCSDGNVNIRSRNRGVAKITSKDADWLRKIGVMICKTAIIRPENRSECYSVEFYSIHLANWLVQHGCLPQKSLTLEFPDVPAKYIAAFIRGCWDGDGTLGLYRIFRNNRNCWETVRSCKLYTGSKVFAEAMIEQLSKLGIRANIFKRKAVRSKIGKRTINSKENYMVCIQNKKSILKFCEIIYFPKNRLSLKRKDKVALKLAKTC